MEAILHKKSSQFTSLYTGDSTAFKHYTDSVDLRIKAEWKNSGDRLMKCAEQYASLRMFLEAATVFNEAADCYLKVDKGEAQKAYGTAVKTFCDLNRYDIAGRIERKIAEIHMRFKHWDDAALHYRKASNFLLSEPEQSDLCLEQSAEALIRSGESSQSHLMYENIAISCANTNLRYFNANGMLFMAVLCLMGVPLQGHPEDKPTTTPAHAHTSAPMSSQQINGGHQTVSSKPNPSAVLDHQAKVKYEEVRQKLAEYDSFTTNWAACKEKLFLQNLLAYRAEEDIDKLVDHIYFWNNVKPLRDIALLLLKVLVDEVKAVVKRKAEQAKAAAEAEKAKGPEKKSKKLIPGKS